MIIVKRFALLACVALLGAGGLAAAAERSTAAGFVDGQTFLELASANEEDTLVEVNIPPSLIRAVSKAVDAEDPGLARTIAGLRGVHAIVLQVAPEREKEAVARTKRVADELTRKGWSPLARVREKSTNINVMILVGSDEDTVEGLTVVGFDKGERNVIFANIAGPMKMSELGKILSRFDLPPEYHQWRLKEEHGAHGEGG